MINQIVPKIPVLEIHFVPSKGITVLVQDYQKFRLSKKSFIVKLHIKLDGNFKQGQKRLYKKEF